MPPPSLLSSLLLGFITLTVAVDVPLDCQQGWENIGSKCYRLFTDVLPWQSADRVCQSYGSQLLKVKDFYENEEIGKFVDRQGTSEYWIGANRGISRLGTQQSDERALMWSDGSVATVAVGYWRDGQPLTDNGQCVLAGPDRDRNRVLWSFAPCERKAAYVCHRGAAPAGTFHCHSGGFVRQDVTCDGDADCKDGSDELNCNSRCTYYIRNQQAGSISSTNFPNVYPNRQTCKWLIELQLGYNVRLELTEFNTERRGDEVQVLAGGLSESASLLLARLSGDLDTAAGQLVFTSHNNLLMVTFSTDDTVSDRGFRAQFSAVKDRTFPATRRQLTATDTPQELLSPFYPEYLGSQDYTWVITAEQKVKIVTLEIAEVDLKGEDKILIRDGDMVYDQLLAELTSSSGADPPYILSTGRDLYVTMQTRGLETGRGFRFNYWQGCHVILNGNSGEIQSPGYRKTGGQYGPYQKCIYDVTLPSRMTFTVRFNSMRLHSSDEVMIYDGSSLLYNVTGTAAPSPFILTSQAMTVVFDSDAIHTEEGFSITYSVGCPDPQFNQWTVVRPATSSYPLGSRITVSCVTGYTFYAREFQDLSVQDGFEALKEVDIECLPGGTWDKESKPKCERRYCGQAPKVSNGYVIDSSGVTYEATVRYQCYPGFAMQGQPTIFCTDTGGWTNAPSCNTAACLPLPATIANGNRVIRSNDGSNFSSIVEYLCYPGYQIVGDPVLFCSSDGGWSADLPRCEALKCYVPTVPNGRVEKSGEMIAVGETVTASCSAGYVSNVPFGGDGAVTCLSDRSLQGLDGFQCSYVDKCISEPLYCDQVCHDSEFQNRTCSCYDGYTLNTNLRTCEDIDECENNTAGCDHFCANTPGGYRCTCAQGFVLFTHDGQQGYSLAQNEDGTRAGDARRIDHTCLPVRCPDPPSVPFGSVLVGLNSFHYGDFVEYACDLGYELSGSPLLACTSSGQWDRQPPICSPAVCLPDSITSVVNRPAVIPSGQVRLGESVTLLCNVAGKPAFNKTRYCIYHEGRFQLAGADYECGNIDCGQPTDESGSVYSGFDHLNTTYGASFRFLCQNLYTVRGLSERNDTTVRCLQDGRWDFGSLRCEGLTCTDPGRPPDGRQVNSTSYEQGKLVHFECDNDGFSLTDPWPLRCQLNSAGNALVWNASVPQCVDTQPPTLAGCVEDAVPVARYSRADTVLSPPTAVDNVYVSEFRIRDLSDVPIWFSNDLVLSSHTVFNTSATDHAGNTAFCITFAAIQDDVPPAIECPANMVREFTVEGEEVNLEFSASDLVNLENETRQLVFSPARVQFTANDQQLLPTFPPSRTYDVTASVQDDTGNTATCQFELLLRPEACSPYSLRTPLHGQKSCTPQQTGSGFVCVLSCQAGYVFHEQPDTATITHSCNRGDAWNVPTTPACVQANETTQHARFLQTYRFTFTKTESGTCTKLSIYSPLLEQQLPTLAQAMPGLCRLSDPNKQFTGDFAITDIAEQGSSLVVVNITVTFDVLERQDYDNCGNLLKTNMEGDPLSYTLPLRYQIFNPLGCPGINTSQAGRQVASEYFCENQKMIMYQPLGYNSPIEVCVPCPEGTRAVGEVCELCREGSYAATPDRLSCASCLAGTSTLSKGAVREAECTAECRAGLYSTTGLSPCLACPKNTYSVNSTFCATCPDGRITRTAASLSASACIPACPKGTYNPIDGHGNTGECLTCPANFFSNSTASRVCTECATNQRTVAEGSTSLSDCIAHTGCNSSNDPCQNGGLCIIRSHAVTCKCLEGFNGRYCQQVVDVCLSRPCYFNGRCTSSGNTFNCDCPAGTEGNRCQTITPSCTPGYCLNGAVCRNDLNTATCLCPLGFTGNRCQNTSPICQPSPCQNNGQCVSLGNVRYRCECTTGYTGKDCEHNIDDCASNPCLHGGNCTDELNGFRCSCPGGFSGAMCQTRRLLCDTADCGTQGSCVEDVDHNTYRCVCREGAYYGTVCQYEAQFGFDLNGSAILVYETTNASLADCMDQCQAYACREFLYDNASSTCKVIDPMRSVSLQFGRSIYYYRVCAKVEETYWTPWYDSYFPGNGSKDGDDETLDSLNLYGLNICGGSAPVAAQCQTVRTRELPVDTLAIDCTPTQGLLCLNEDQPGRQCSNYEIRFQCLSTRVLSQSSCEDINYCNSSVCGNGGSCMETATEPSCTCATAFTGSRCQHDTDDCANGPCINNGTCVDLFNDYRCDCQPGFGGRRCQTDVNECFPDPCSSVGTARCVDGNNRYECQCNPGFTGDRCEDDVDECLSQPCLHGGQCLNQANNFTCNCSPGWTGHTCDVQVQKCTNDTCQNGAACKNLFNDFYCACLPNTYGKTCSNAPSICAKANPCIHSSTCSESHGTAKCECSTVYTGDGCEIIQDICSETQSLCKNGATCGGSLGHFYCICPEGWGGAFCDENINDCQVDSCLTGGTCIDMVNEFYCRCPVGRSGESCQKDTDRQFDLHFSKPQKTSMAAMPYPLRVQGGGFTITMWIQYMRKGETGTIFTLFQVRDGHSLAEKRELLRLDEMGLTLSFDGHPVRLNTTVDYNMDGEWHYIVLSWNQTTGLFSFFVDTIRIPLTDYLKGEPLDLFVWLMLGCRYDPATDSCREGEGYMGDISQVALYSRELSFTDELTILGNNDPFYVFPGALMTWGEFIVYPGVTRIYPSKADQSCPRDFGGAGCKTAIPGKTAVTIDDDSCPSDIIKYSTKRVTQVTWPDIKFKGRVNSVKSSLSSGTVFLWGKYPVVVQATNMDGNAALCAFDIYVQYDQCKEPDTPVNAGQVFCANFDDPWSRRYRQCSVSCQPNYRVVVPNPLIHTCGPVGSWDPPKRYLPYTLPPCGETSTPKRRLEVSIEYHVPSLECPEVTQEVREQMTRRLQQQNSRWSNSVCHTTDCSDVTLNITCDRGVAGAGPQGRKSDVAVTLSITDITELLTSTADSRLTISPEDLFQQLVLSDTVFDFSATVAEAVPDPNGLDVKVHLLCQSPKTLNGDKCVECAPGSHHDTANSRCSLCGVGFYQPFAGQSECEACSPGTITETVGATDSAQCKEICNEGQYYSNTMDRCELCPQGFYQDGRGLFHCLPCPVDKTTRQPGARSSAYCFNDCKPGEELAENGTCTACLVGFYKPGDQTLCGPCDAGLVTNATGADSRDDCNVADNQPGYYRTRPDETKSLPCPIGTYQPDKWQYNCLSCGGDRYRTDSMGSTSLDDCKFFCPEGQEKDGDQDLCKPCDIGYYRTGDDPYSACQLCPNNTRTMSTGSSKLSDCAIYKCSPGYRPIPGREDCEPCPRGYYQPLPDQTDCLQCMGANMDTRADGAMSQTQCERYCDPGYEKMDNGTCVICPIGFYKDNTIDTFHQCTRCSDRRFVTPAAGASSQSQCTVLDCGPGYKINGNVCDLCPQGSYQDKPYQTTCIGCPPGQSTRHNTSTSPDDCETYCQPGKEKTGDQCETCERGYYKNNLNNVFMPCTLCPPEYVTREKGSTTPGECTVRNCTEGQYINGNTCLLCNFGYYQPYKWQTTCLKCGTDRTTQRNGAVNESECILSCKPGKENRPGSTICTECPQGYYKTKEEAALCDPCPTGLTTRINGSVSSTDCDLSACQPGSYASANSLGGCTSCPFGQYQPREWQETCLDCPPGYTTYQRGAHTKDLCLLDCLPGFEYNNVTKSCEPCPKGYYNDDLDPSRYTCIVCNIEFITSKTGAKSDRDCNVRNCTVDGQYRDPVDNVCRDCPRGQWQNQKWQTMCESCEVGRTTRYTGTTTPDDCLFDCADGTELADSGNKCTPCPVGSYRDADDSWECQKCPDGLTTQRQGGASRQECSISTCSRGFFFNNDGQVQACQQCPRNSYQDQSGQFTCKPCPPLTETRMPGATLPTDCVGKCLTNSNNCDVNAQCASTTLGVTCVCDDGYQGDGTNCTHICDVPDFCRNSASCDRRNKKCVCTENYTGKQCELRAERPKLGEKDIILISTLTTLAFLLFLILIIVCCCVMARRRSRNKVPFAETSDERASIATRMSTRGFNDFDSAYATKATLATGTRMMLPAQAQQMFENPVFTVGSEKDPAVYKV